MTYPTDQTEAPQGAVMPTLTIQGASAIGGITLRCFGQERLLMIIPLSERMGQPFEGKPGDPLVREMVCNVVVLDGGPVRFGGSATNTGQMKTPDTMIVDPMPAGWFIPNMVLRGPSMLRALEAALPSQFNPAGSALVGRIWQDPAYRNAWKLRENPPQAEVDLAMQWWANFSAGRHVNPVPRLIAAPVAPQQQVNYGYQPQQPAQGYAPQQAPQQPYAPAQYDQAGGYPQPLGGQAAPVQQGPNPAWPTQQAPVQQQPVYAPQQPAQAASAQIPPAPPGFDPTAWAGMSDEQRAHYLGGVPAAY